MRQSGPNQETGRAKLCSLGEYALLLDIERYCKPWPKKERLRIAHVA